MDIVRLKDTDGKTRKFYKIECPVCKEDFFQRIRKRNGKELVRLYCSTVCSNKINKEDITCAQCNKEFSRYKERMSHSKSGLHFCCRKCKDVAQRIDGLKEIHPPHYGNGKNHYRRKFDAEELICQRCGYKEFASCVQIHHIDENRENDNIDNLIPLCACCHQALHWKLEEIIK